MSVHRSALLLATCFVLVGVSSAAASQRVIDRPVAFRVLNQNRSALACPSDGAKYTIRGRIVGPAAKVRSGRVNATLYLHEFAFGQFFWRFPIRRYDYAIHLARRGHVSVIVDRLGYDRSPGPAGYSICFGSQADMVHQVIKRLRSGRYSARGIAPPRAKRVALAGHSVGGLTGEILAYSFGGIDAFLLLSWADQGFSTYITAELAESGLICSRGGQPAHPGGPGGYAYVGQTPADFRTVFADYEERVFKLALKMRNRDPCGDIGSVAPALALNRQRVGEIRVPVFMLHGLEDVVFEDPWQAGRNQEQLYTGARSITHLYWPRTGHEFTLGRTGPKIRSALGRWLRGHGF